MINENMSTAYYKLLKMKAPMSRGYTKTLAYNTNPCNCENTPAATELKASLSLGNLVFFPWYSKVMYSIPISTKK